MIANATNLEKMTNLPIQVVSFADKPFSDVLVYTPHKGEVTIRLKDTHRKLFGGADETDVALQAVLSQLATLELEAKSYLFKKWLIENEK